MSEETDRVQTRVAHAGNTDHRFFGRSLYGDLEGNCGFWDLVSLSLGGPELNDSDRALLDDISTVASVADPRIPPLKLVRLMGTYGGVFAALGGGLMVLEDAFIGPWSSGVIAKFLVDFSDAIDHRVDDLPRVRSTVLDYLDKRKVIVGYGVAFRNRDERVQAVARCVHKRQRQDGQFWRLMTNIETVLLEEKGLGANIGAGIAAPALDIGFSPPQAGLIATMLVFSCLLSNARETAEQASPLLGTLPERFVKYVGHKPRLSPRAKGDE